MNRRNFLKRFGQVAAGATAVAAIPSTIVSMNHNPPQIIRHIGEYADYTSFSDFARKEAIDKMVSEMAEELGHRAGLSMKEIWATEFDNG